MIDGLDIPQANSLDLARDIVVAVAAGATSPAEIGREIDLVPRHIQYYLQAARILGWIRMGDEGWETTELGRELLSTIARSTQETEVFRKSISANDSIRAVAPDLLDSKPFVVGALIDRLISNSTLSPATSRRRANTLVAWRDRVLSRQSQLFSNIPQAKAAIRVKPVIAQSQKPPSTPRPVLTSLSLRNFKNFEQATLPIAPLTLLIGANAAGKSNIRDAFRFLHGIARGYTLAEIIGEKYIEGGALQWKGIRGGTREVTFQSTERFVLEAGFRIPEGDREREAAYRIEVEVDRNGKPPKVTAERLVIQGRGEYVFDSHPEKNAPTQDDPFHLSVKLRKGFRSGFVGPNITVISNKPAISQLLDHPDVTLAAVKDHVRMALAAFSSMRFLDLSPDAMRIPSLPGQTILGDRGENLSSVLQAIHEDASAKKNLVEWVRELTPLDASSFDFPADQTGRVLLTLIEESGQRTSAYSASDGTLRFLAMIAALLGPEPADFYFFEELENGIYPTRLFLLLQLIQQQTDRHRCQVVATTHSPQLLSFLGEQNREAAVLVHRESRSASAQITKILDIAGARKVLEKQDLAKLYSTGWLENALAFGSVQ